MIKSECHEPVCEHCAGQKYANVMVLGCLIIGLAVVFFAACRTTRYRMSPAESDCVKSAMTNRYLTPKEQAFIARGCTEVEQMRRQNDLIQ